ncbi:hypothetical protein UA38_12075 [Photobacterium kishitanii]|uniref:Uncharacterized protein n=1 Tax=Photobacterium kishitanii TaxID=318456 RepID=A0AAX0YSR9_9GAMM|nr:hypothetical protein [Photobacterium kishitanii]KJG57102.1 hypothetical protein UA38_12075 [Photobacterium kishitanii]KJG60629.1 hypothetical protein UA42_14875 [Photobacterium kishitanii]KJG64932.1 hypothetical protein UA40_14575 [Photobacterium kishitanii]KJG66174.1 hypothetical protein UA41_21245 [Photobacterium kishitanii]OBU31462.1 hypothetical protein AYY23_19570 [Photobacterium kishitanii]
MRSNNILEEQFSGYEFFSKSPCREITLRMKGKNLQLDELFDNLDFDNQIVIANTEEWYPLLETFSEFSDRHGHENIRIFNTSEKRQLTAKHIFNWVLFGRPEGNC